MQRETELLEAIKAEMSLYANLAGPIPANSLQIGGGTSSLISNKGLVRLLDSLNKHCNFANDAERKIELFPKQYPAAELREKLAILRDYGFTDIVIDQESGNAKTLKTIGRRISSLSVYCELVEECVRAGFSSVVTALMFGLPFETFESIESTIRTLLAMPEVRIVNTFPTIIREPDPIFAQCQRNPQWFPDAERRDAMWLLARNMLQEAGFAEGPLNFWHLPTKVSTQQTHKLAGANLLGFGPSAFGYLGGDAWGAEYINHCTFSDYYAAIERQQLPVWRAGELDAEDLARRQLIQGLANCVPVELEKLEEDLGVSVDDLFGRTLNALVDLELIIIDRKNVICYTEEGRCRHEEVSHFLASREVNEKVCAPISRSDRYRDVLLRHNFYPVVAQEEVANFESFAMRFPKSYMC